MNIVVTDGYTLNPGDLNWQAIEAFGQLTVYERTPVDLLIERCKTADIILTNKVPFSKETIQALENIKLISITATGYNIIDTNATKEKGITVCNVPDYGTDSVAQHTFALLLELVNGVGINSFSVKQGDWVKCKDFAFSKTPLIELSGKTIGIVGFGNIGQQTARIAKAFGMKVLYTGPNKKDTDLGEYTDMQTLFVDSDFISLHCPLKPGNHQFVNKALLAKMKPSAFLINTARGQLIHEQDLADALNAGLIAGAALDVLSAEPPKESNPLLSAKNTVITPHNAWMSKEARQRIMSVTAKNIEAFVNKRPINVVA